jgi:hypothetical protein
MPVAHTPGLDFPSNLLREGHGRDRRPGPLPPLRLLRLAIRPPRACCMEQSWNNRAAESLCFPVFARKHCSLDLSFSSARRARHSIRVPFSISPFALVWSSTFGFRIRSCRLCALRALCGKSARQPGHSRVTIPLHQTPMFPAFSLRDCYRIGRHFIAKNYFATPNPPRHGSNPPLPASIIK